MKHILVNGIATCRSSLGVRNYYEAIMQRLSWPAGVSTIPAGRSPIWDRLRETFARGSKDGLIWSPVHRGPLFASNHVVTVHDSINLRHVHPSGIKHVMLRAMSQRLYDNAAAIVAISDATAATLCETYRVRPERIVVIRSSNEPISLAEPNEDDLRELGAAARYVLLVTNRLAHKNTLRACRAVACAHAAGADIAMRIVGPVGPEAIEICQRTNLTLVVEQRVTAGRLTALYRSAALMLSPSIEEGHNLVIAEALNSNALVIASDIPAHREFYPNEVDFFDPLDVDAMTQAILHNLDKAARPWRHDLRITRTWQDVADDYAQLFATI